MSPTIVTLVSGLAILLVGVGLLGTLLGVRATQASFSNLQTGTIMAAYYLGYVSGTLLVPRIIRNVGHIRTFAALAAVTAACSLMFGLIVNPWAWFLLRLLNGLSVVGLYMVVESWLSEQSHGPARGRIFSTYMMSTLIALGGGQFLILAGGVDPLQPFAVAAILIAVGVIPIAVTRVSEPRIEIAEPVGLRRLMQISALGTVGTFCAGVVNGSFWGMTPVFGQRLALPHFDIALLMSATILGGALLQWPIGHLSDRFDRRTVLIAIACCSALAAALVALVVFSGYPGLTVAAAIYGGLMFSLYGLCVAHTNDHLAHGQVLEATRGLLLVYGIGALFGPLISGVAMDLVGPVGLPAFSAASAALLALYGLYRLTRRAPPPREEQTEFTPMVRTTPVVLGMHPDADPEQEQHPDHGQPPHQSVD